MKLFKLNDYIEVVCDTANTRNGFKHTATLLFNGIDREDTKMCYQNRTWERYQYESVLSRLVERSEVLNEQEKELAKKFISNYH